MRRTAVSVRLLLTYLYVYTDGVEEYVFSDALHHKFYIQHHQISANPLRSEDQRPSF